MTEHENSLEHLTVMADMEAVSVYASVEDVRQYYEELLDAQPDFTSTAYLFQAVYSLITMNTAISATSEFFNEKCD